MAITPLTAGVRIVEIEVSAMDEDGNASRTIMAEKAVGFSTVRLPPQVDSAVPATLATEGNYNGAIADINEAAA